MWWNVTIKDPTIPENPPSIAETFETNGLTQELVEMINNFMEENDFDTKITLMDLRCLTCPSQRIACKGTSHSTGRPKTERMAKWLILEKIYKRTVLRKGKRTFETVPAPIMTK
jgi:hypothetical protein